MHHRFVVVLQIVVESSNAALEYGDLTVDENSPVNPDLHFDSQLMHLYVMTEKKVRISTLQHVNC
jgi:plexin A